MRRILFYDDGCIFGGHQAMTVRAARFLAARPDWEVHFMHYRGNRLLAKRLQPSPIVLHPIDFASRSFVGNLRSLYRALDVRGFFDAIAPDLVLVAQGRVEECLLGLVAARLGRYPLLSYLPLAHPMRQVKQGRQSFLSTAVDWADGFFYQLPDRFIVPSRRTGELLREKGLQTPISVVYNGIDLEKLTNQPRCDVRHRLGIAPEAFLVGMVGRIQFVHKAQDLLIKAVVRHQELLRGIQFLFVGDGPDAERLQRLIQQYRLEGQAIWQPWSADLPTIYSALDMLAIPSRLEGLPLVMLEAMHYGLPIVASNIDGMAELLPPEWLFPCGDADALVRTLLAVKAADNRAYLDAHRRRIAEEFTVEAFGKAFLEALL